MVGFESLISLLVIGLALCSAYRKRKMKETMAAKKAIDAMAELQQTAPETGGWEFGEAPHSEQVAAKREAFKSSFISRPEMMVVPEGTDPCHDDMFEMRVAEDAPIAEKGVRNALADEVVRGIVWAEILQKPKFSNRSAE